MPGLLDWLEAGCNENSLWCGDRPLLANLKKILTTLFGRWTLTITFCIVGLASFDNLSKFFSSLSGSTFKADFLVSTLLVISHLIRLCTAGKIAQRWHPKRSYRVCMGTYRVVSPATTRTYTSSTLCWRKSCMWYSRETITSVSLEITTHTLFPIFSKFTTWRTMVCFFKRWLKMW